MRLLRSLFFLTILVPAIALAESAPIEVSTQDRINQAPATIRVKVRIEPHKENRAWCLVADSDTFQRLSCEQIDRGDEAAVFYHTRLKGLPGGEYVLMAWVCRDSRCNERKTAQTTFLVSSSAAEDY